MLDVAEDINMLKHAESEDWCNHKVPHLALCLLKLIEELDYVAHLLVIKQLLDIWLQCEQRFEHKMYLVKSNEGLLPQGDWLHTVNTVDSFTEVLS